MKLLLPVALVLTLVAATCTPVEKQSYRTVVAAKAFLDSVKSQHPECVSGDNTSTLCVDLHKATAAKDALIDATTVYCSGPTFLVGGPCDAPSKDSPAFSQANAKLQAALANYQSIEADLKGVLK